MDDLTWSQSSALLVAFYSIVALLYACWPKRPDRKWLKRLQANNRARSDWNSRVSADQKLFKDN